MSRLVWPKAELEHLDLAGGERLGPAVALLGLGELLGERDHELRVDHHVAAGHQAHGLDQVLGVPSLEDVAPRSAPTASTTNWRSSQR